MQLFIPTNKVPFSLILGIETDKPERLKIEVKDNRKPATFYVNRKATVNKYREFELTFPKSPQAAILVVYNTAKGDMPLAQDTSIRLKKLEPSKLIECPIWMKDSTKSFVKFAQQFTDNASILSSGKRKPHIYRSDDAKFHIDYFDIIRDKKTGAIINTPARVGHQTGIIEVSKKDFLRYTVPMRMIILLHEYAHKHLNKDIGRPIDDEIGADVNALSIYLSLGYSPLEAHYAFLNVFKTANNAGNRKRYLVLSDFIHKFTSGKFTTCKIGSNGRGN